MKNLILSSIDHPETLEKLYQSNKVDFKNAFAVIYPSLENNLIADCWNERLKIKEGKINWGNKSEWIRLLVLCLLAALTAQIPKIFKLNELLFFQKHIGFLIFLFPSVYFLWLNKPKVTLVLMIGSVFLFGLLFINMGNTTLNSATFILSCIHLPILFAFIFGLSYLGNDWKSKASRIRFLKFMADLLIICGLILLSFGILSAITINLFETIGIHIEAFYTKYIIQFFIAPLPLIGTFIIKSNPTLINKLSPIIAKIFSPLVLVTLVGFLLAFFLGKKQIVNDRSFLILFNALLIAVMALIFFSISNNSRTTKKSASNLILLLLSITTIVVNLCALLAIYFRIVELGLTPNRLAVVGSNILILIHLTLTTSKIWSVVFANKVFEAVKFQIVTFLPVYLVWISFVCFVFPFLFSFK